MPRLLWVAIVTVAAVTAARAGASTPPATVACGSSIGASAHPRTGGYRIVLGVAGVPPPYLAQVVRSGAAQAVPGWPKTWWRKNGLLIGAGKPAVTISVPPRLRRDVMLTWGGVTGVALRFPRCAPSGPLWAAYAGGFLLRERRLCVTLDVTAGGRSRSVRFGLGRRC